MATGTSTVRDHGNDDDKRDHGNEDDDDDDDDDGDDDPDADHDDDDVLLTVPVVSCPKLLSHKFFTYRY